MPDRRHVISKTTECLQINNRRKPRLCLMCEEYFMSVAPDNRICPDCVYDRHQNGDTLYFSLKERRNVDIAYRKLEKRYGVQLTFNGEIV